MTDRRDLQSLVKNLEGLTQDSRGVKEGYLFAALGGSKTDGRKYISDALRNGAVAVLAPTGTQLPAEAAQDVTLITDDNPRRALALMAAAFYGRQPAHIAAVTGTNGKTSTVHFVKQLWRAQNIKAASIGTLGVRAPGLTRSGSMTTPDPVSLHAELADLAAAGVTHLAIEASSHGLDQHRLDGVQVGVAAFTNLSRDHLDYHTDMESYFNAKRRLFTDVARAGGHAVLNADTQEYETLRADAQGAGLEILSYGRAGREIRILGVEPAPQGQNVRVEIFGAETVLNLPLVGDFQVMNALCALGVALAGDRRKAQGYMTALAHLRGAPGRLELVGGHPKQAAVYIDYAHTPAALENVLTALRAHTPGRLVCLFGCGGDRDAGKRPLMAGVAARLADIVLVTDDNPRSEDPAAIRADILKGAPAAREIADRRKAIEDAVAMLNDGDVLVIAGKGHEQGQVFAEHVEPFDDAAEAAKAMEALHV
jgi:UDP-N-acetylmuramoyl-L-alanyl-D-glutamate--2,6-diaminopimelate ligase